MDTSFGLVSRFRRTTVSSCLTRPLHRQRQASRTAAARAARSRPAATAARRRVHDGKPARWAAGSTRRRRRDRAPRPAAAAARLARCARPVARATPSARCSPAHPVPPSPPSPPPHTRPPYAPGPRLRGVRWAPFPDERYPAPRLLPTPPPLPVPVMVWRIRHLAGALPLPPPRRVGRHRRSA